ncbi:TPA: C/D box methylation guide ribonucleoprotein complex aNOP56 subunit, partial [Candidatus Bathyarchaeota archaeon]|nr:C/D box methylation guide ribonucleoprotein complex aNOP56 subunit [Candidatus Bathyarchaeota archaeon]
FPELNRLLDRHETYARLVNDLRERKNFTFEKLLEEGLPKTKALRVFVAAQASMGTDLSETDIKLLTEFSEYILELYRLRDSLDQYLDDLMSNVAPNIHAITGATLGARLISLAGGLDNLAKMPASTIQVLGAEKALFRALKTGSRPPKHGVIFQHHFIHEAKRWQRGKIARLLAGKIAIAARIDAYSGKYIGDSLQRDLEKRLSEIKEKYQKPKIKEQKARRSQRRKKSVRGGRKHERKS